MSARDELARLVYEVGYQEYDNPQIGVRAVADAILAAGYRKPRTVYTAQQVETLFNSDANVVLMDEDGIITQNLVGGWTSPTFSDGQYLSSETLHKLFGPKFIVLTEQVAE